MKMAEELHGILFHMRTYYPEDVTEEYVEWLNDKTVNQYLEVYSKYTLADEKKYVSDILNSENEILMAIIEKERSTVIGSVHLTENIRHKRCDIAYMIGNKTYWNRGIASEAIKLATKWAFQSLDINRINAGFYSANIGSRKALLNAGFKIEAERRNYFIGDNGEIYDDIEVGLLREDFNRQTAT